MMNWLEQILILLMLFIYYMQNTKLISNSHSIRNKYIKQVKMKSDVERILTKITAKLDNFSAHPLPLPIPKYSNIITFDNHTNFIQITIHTQMENIAKHTINIVRKSGTHLSAAKAQRNQFNHQSPKKYSPYKNVAIITQQSNNKQIKNDRGNQIDYISAPVISSKQIVKEQHEETYISLKKRNHALQISVKHLQDRLKALQNQFSPQICLNKQKLQINVSSTKLLNKSQKMRKDEINITKSHKNSKFINFSHAQSSKKLKKAENNKINDKIQKYKKPDRSLTNLAKSQEKLGIKGSRYQIFAQKKANGSNVSFGMSLNNIEEKYKNDRIQQPEHNNQSRYSLINNKLSQSNVNNIQELTILNPITSSKPTIVTKQFKKPPKASKSPNGLERIKSATNLRSSQEKN